MMRYVFAVFFVAVAMLPAYSPTGFGVLIGGSTIAEAQRRPVNGACGKADDVAVTSKPTSNLCSAGTASRISGTGPWTWNCTGSNRGTTAQCSAPVKSAAVNGSCGSANGTDVASAPSSNLCSAGTASGVSGSGPWSWDCAGANGGVTALCSAQLVANGSCGSANAVAVVSAPSSNLCAAGTASSVSGSGPWSWTCAGIGSGAQAASCLAPLASSGQAPGNTMTIANVSGTSASSYPLQFGRPFVDGAVANAPQVLINGSAVTTQADVKNRYSDGSVEYAVIAVVIPSIPAGGSLTLTFQNQTAPNNTPLTQAQMLGSNYNFDAVLSVTGAGAGATAQTVSARAMLASGDYKLWTSGPVAQTIMLGDDSAAAKYDIGFGDGYHPLRPRFYATFWPATNQVTVRVVGENMLTTAVEDIAYKLSISTGQSSPSMVYSADLSGTQATNPKRHWSMTAWTQRFWLGGPPNPEVNIDNNLAYLESTRFFPNYDTAITVPESQIEQEYALWTGQPHDLYDGAWDGGLWQSGMGTSGSRPEIAPYPQWSVMWMYTGDWRLRQMALGMADLAPAFPGQLREGNPAKRLSRADPAGSGTGLGHAVSITDRKTLVTAVFGYSYTTAADNINFVGAVNEIASGGPWSFDEAHQPAAFYPQYILTGDPWYLNEMYLWAGFTAARANGADTGDAAGRGPDGAYGGIDDQLRGAGWGIRNRAEAAFAAPDSDPEKAYFTYLTNDALARWEGSFGITGTAYDGTAIKTWGAQTGNYYTSNGGPVSGRMPVLGNWESAGYPNGSDGTVEENVSGGTFAPSVGAYTTPWNHEYLLYGIGRTVELGFAAGPLQAQTVGKYMTGMINNSGYPELIGMYEIPSEANCANTSGGCTAPPGGFYSTWPAVVAAIPAPFLTGVGWNPAGNGGDGYLAQYFAGGLTDDGRPIYAMGGLAMMVDNGDPGAAQAWSWFLPNVYHAISPGYLQWDPKWVIVPRTDTNTLPPQPTATPSVAGST